MKGGTTKIEYTQGVRKSSLDLWSLRFLGHIQLEMSRRLWMKEPEALGQVGIGQGDHLPLGRVSCRSHLPIVANKRNGTQKGRRKLRQNLGDADSCERGRERGTHGED